MKRKILIIFIISFLILFSIIKNVYSDTLIDSYGISNGSNAISVTPTNDYGIGLWFNTTDYFNVTTIQFYMYRSGFPNANLSVRIYQSPNYPSLVYPLLIPDYKSDYVNTLDIGTSLELVNFTFTDYTFKNNTGYYILLYIESVVLMDNSNKVIVRIDTTSPTHYGYLLEIQNNLHLRAITNYDIIFYVYGNSFILSESEQTGYTESDLEENLIMGSLFGCVFALILIPLILKKRK